MKSNVLRFEDALFERPTSLPLSDVQSPSGSPAVTGQGFHVPLPTIDPSFVDDAPPPRKLKSDAPIDATAALESMPHLLHKIQALWNSRDLNTFIACLLMDSRDGERAGFPFGVARELIFLSRTNLVLRAQEAAPLLGVSLGEAVDLISKGDQMALGHSNSADDVWAHHVSHASVDAATHKPNATINQIFSLKQHKPKTEHRHREPSLKLVPFITERPPLPQAVRLDITTPTALRSARAGFEPGGTMDGGLFRCLAKELSNNHIGQLVLSSLGDSTQCAWLPSGIRFARTQCQFTKLVLQVDLLSAPENLLCQCMQEGIGHLVIYLNQASGKWRAQAQQLSATDPDYFRREIGRLVAFRDQYQAATGRRCEISVASTAHRASHAMATYFHDLDHLPGLVAYDEVLLPPGIRAKDVAARGQCHCLSPFIEAHVRTNGHLVACAMDHSGYSFTADLTHTSFTDAWQGQAYRMVRQRVARGEQAGRLCEICPHHTPPNSQ
ncbi:SPASM domain-containing protein [Dechloromonas sp. XY25]|uniref:SPASM domain-containing protein n=1 Tax=Dechloromonas hankyongensis TaxID=2908002 RepID=A0ABS9K1X5_9RHOO|nr:SPASM domain-containing protein [Dechloromonas hankyongensis]MCG2577148.1 SPASM domain-containing protein [Dechloromonas hankyongensis]